MQCTNTYAPMGVTCVLVTSRQFLILNAALICFNTEFFCVATVAFQRATERLNVDGFGSSFGSQRRESSLNNKSIVTGTPGPTESLIDLTAT